MTILVYLFLIKENIESNTIVVLYLKIDDEHRITFLQCKDNMIEFHLHINGLLFAGPLKEPV